MKNTCILKLKNGELFVSYNTPVAFFCYKTKTYFVAAKKYSPTTSRHLSRYLTDVDKSQIEYVADFSFNDGINDHIFDEDLINEKLDAELAFHHGIELIDIIDYITR